MRKLQFHLPFSMISLCMGAIGVLAIVYIGLIAMVMSYAALTVDFSQSVKSDQAALAILESDYLMKVESIQSVDYRSIGYAAPLKKTFVPAMSQTALR